MHARESLIPSCRPTAIRGKEVSGIAINGVGRDNGLLLSSAAWFRQCKTSEVGRQGCALTSVEALAGYMDVSSEGRFHFSISAPALELEPLHSYPHLK